MRQKLIESVILYYHRENKRPKQIFVCADGIICVVEVNKVVFYLDKRWRINPERISAGSQVVCLELNDLVNCVEFQNEDNPYRAVMMLHQYVTAESNAAVYSPPVELS